MTRSSPEKERMYQKRHRDKIRLAAMEVVGRGRLECSNCGCNNILLLEINHLNGGGAKELRHGNPYRFYADLAQGRRPTDDLNLLCRMCNALHTVRLKYPEIGVRFEILWRPHGWEDYAGEGLTRIRKGASS